MTLLQSGFGQGFPDPLYTELSGTTYAQVKDAFGNPVANALAKFSVTQGDGKLMNHMARWCRDNAGDAFASYCWEQWDVAQSTAVPETMDTFKAYGNHVCSPMDPEQGWTPDDQCDNISWWTNNFGDTILNYSIACRIS